MLLTGMWQRVGASRVEAFGASPGGHLLASGRAAVLQTCITAIAQDWGSQGIATQGPGHGLSVGAGAHTNTCLEPQPVTALLTAQSGFARGWRVLRPGLQGLPPGPLLLWLCTQRAPLCLAARPGILSSLSTLRLYAGVGIHHHTLL